MIYDNLNGMPIKATQSTDVINAKQLFDVLEELKQNSNPDVGLKEPKCLEKVQFIICDMAQKIDEYKMARYNFRLTVEDEVSRFYFGFDKVDNKLIDFMENVADSYIGNKEELRFIVEPIEKEKEECTE